MGRRVLVRENNLTVTQPVLQTHVSVKELEDVALVYTRSRGRSREAERVTREEGEGGDLEE